MRSARHLCLVPVTWLHLLLYKVRNKRSPDLCVILFTARSVTTSNTVNIKEINDGGIYRIQRSDAA